MRNKSTIKVEWKRKTGMLRPCSKAGLEQQV